MNIFTLTNFPHMHSPQTQLFKHSQELNLLAQREACVNDDYDLD